MRTYEVTIFVQLQATIEEQVEVEEAWELPQAIENIVRERENWHTSEVVILSHGSDAKPSSWEWDDESDENDE